MMIKSIKSKITAKRKAKVITILNKIKSELTEDELKGLEHTLSLYRHRKFNSR